MATYHYYKQGYAIPYDAFGHVVLKKHIDSPAIIASGVAGCSPLGVSNVRTALPSTGFGIGDTLQVFRVPVGFMAHSAGIRVTTPEGAAATISFGYATATSVHTGAAATAGLIAAATSLNSAATIITAVGDAVGADALMGIVVIVTTTFDLVFAGAAVETAIWDIWVEGFKVF